MSDASCSGSATPATNTTDAASTGVAPSVKPERTGADGRGLALMRTGLIGALLRDADNGSAPAGRRSQCMARRD